MESGLRYDRALSESLITQFDELRTAPLNLGNQEFFKAWCESQDLCNVRFVSREEYESRRAAGDIWEPPVANARPTLILPDNLQFHEMREIAEAINHRFLEDPTAANTQLGENWDAHEEHIAHFRAALRGPLEEILEEEPTPPLPANPDWSWLDDRLARYPELEDPMRVEAEESGVDFETSNPFDRFILAAQEGSELRALTELLEDIHAAPLRMLITTVHRRAVEALFDSFETHKDPFLVYLDALPEQNVPQELIEIQERIESFAHSTQTESSLPFSEAKHNREINCVIHILLASELVKKAGMKSLTVMVHGHVFLFAVSPDDAVYMMNIGSHGPRLKRMSPEDFQEKGALEQIVQFSKQPDRSGLRLQMNPNVYPGVTNLEDPRPMIEMTDPEFANEEVITNNLLKFFRDQEKGNGLLAAIRNMMTYPSIIARAYYVCGNILQEEGYFQKALMLDPQNPIAWKQLGERWLRAAGKTIGISFDHREKDFDIQDELKILREGIPEEAQKLYRMAVHSLQKACELNPHYSENWIRLAEAQARSGDHEAALETYLYLGEIDFDGFGKYATRAFISLLHRDPIIPKAFEIIFGQEPQSCFELTWVVIEKRTLEAGVQPTKLLHILLNAINLSPDPNIKGQLLTEMTTRLKALAPTPTSS